MRRVLIIRSNQLLAAGVESLLLQKNDVILMSVALNNEMAIRAEIGTFRPDVLILDESQVDPDLAVLLTLIKDFPDLRIVVVNTDANKLHIYEKHDVFVKKAKDLIAFVQ
jgi:chemotaxis response regulator CheB